MAEVIRTPSDYPAGAAAIWPWRPSSLRQAAWLAGFVAVCFAAAGVGGAITATTVEDWYQTLAKPEWTPPDWLFGPVWTLLYLMMGVAAWLVWRRGGWSAGRLPLTLFGVQLAHNVLWSAVFFGMRQPAGLDHLCRRTECGHLAAQPVILHPLRRLCRASRWHHDHRTRPAVSRSNLIHRADSRFVSAMASWRSLG